MKHINRKGQVLQNIGALGIGIATLTVILAIVFIMVTQVRDTTVSNIVAATVTNESISWTNNTAVTLSNQCLTLSCTLYNNSALTASVSTAQYSCAISGESSASITVWNSSAGAIIYPAYLTYSCARPSGAYNSTVSLRSAAATIPGWVALIVLVSLGGIILGLVSAFKRD